MTSLEAMLWAPMTQGFCFWWNEHEREAAACGELRGQKKGRPELDGSGLNVRTLSEAMQGWYVI